LLISLTPAPLSDPDPSITAAIPADLESLDRWLVDREADSPFPLIEGTEKRIRWQQQGRRSEWAIVYLHGFSATRQEISPTMELVADAIGANMFETRLYGHGRSEGGLEAVRAERWLLDGIEALDIGALIGEKIILVGTSTGATLAAALSDHPMMATVSDMILISPNFAVQDSRSEILTLPAGPLLADLLIGKTRSFQTINADQARYWTSTYPTRALVEAMRLVKYARKKLPMTSDARLLMIISSQDQVISPDAAVAAFESSQVARKQLIDIDNSDDPMNHVVTGRIMSPSTTERVAAIIVAFLTNTDGTMKETTQ
jgi:esterase/lipase